MVMEGSDGYEEALVRALPDRADGSGPWFDQPVRGQIPQVGDRPGNPRHGERGVSLPRSSISTATEA